MRRNIMGEGTQTTKTNPLRCDNEPFTPPPPCLLLTWPLTFTLKDTQTVSLHPLPPSRCSTTLVSNAKMPPLTQQTFAYIWISECLMKICKLNYSWRPLTQLKHNLDISSHNVWNHSTTFMFLQVRLMWKSRWSIRRVTNLLRQKYC